MINKLFTLVLILATLFISSTVSALGIYYPTDGIYSIQPKFAPDKELSVQGHASNWGANVIIDNLNSGWQKWKIQRIQGTHFYSIVAVSSNLAIDVANAQASDGANIATWPFLEGRQNQFAFFDAGGGCYVIKANLDGNFVLDVERAENRAGANVLSWSFNGGDNQLWRLVMIRRLPEFQSYNKRATRKVTAYVMPDLQARSGNEWVDSGDNVTVLREEGNAYLVRYPVSGGTKTRWVNKNEIFSGSNLNSQVYVNIPSDNSVPTNLQNLINTYKNQIWNDHTYLSDVKECKEFASFIFNKMYGVGYIGSGSTSANPKNYLINLSNPNRVALRSYKTNLTAQSARELFQNAQAGDFVQIRRRHGGAHSAIFVKRIGDGVVLFEANANKYTRNLIEENTYSYSELSDKNFAMSLYYAK